MVTEPIQVWCCCKIIPCNLVAAWKIPTWSCRSSPCKRALIPFFHLTKGPRVLHLYLTSDPAVVDFIFFLEDISPFVGPLIHRFGCLPWVSKPGLTPSRTSLATCMQWIYQIPLWCDTYWPLDSQHGGQAILIHILIHIQALVELKSEIEHTAVSKRVTRQTLYRMSYARCIFNQIQSMFPSK